MVILSKGVADNYVSENALIVASEMFFQHFAYVIFTISKLFMHLSIQVIVSYYTLLRA